MEKENFGLTERSRTEKEKHLETFGSYKFWEPTGQVILSAEKPLRQNYTTKNIFEEEKC